MCSIQQTPDIHYGTESYWTLTEVYMHACVCVCVCTGLGALLDVIIHVRYTETNQIKQNQLVPESVGCLQMCEKIHT